MVQLPYLVFCYCAGLTPIPEDITLVAGGVISSVACTVDGSFASIKMIVMMFYKSCSFNFNGWGFELVIGDVVFRSHYGEKLFKSKSFFSNIVTQKKRYEWIQKIW